jgi:hypothetical protein
MIHAFSYRGIRYEDAVAAIDAGIAELRLRPSKASFERARAALENDFRWFRVPRSEIADHVARWLDPERGDPRIVQWQELPSLSYEKFTAYADVLAARPPLVGVLADRTKLDVDVLSRYGRVVEGSVDVIRDPGQADGTVLDVY